MASSLAVARRAALQARAAVRIRHYANIAAAETPVPTTPAPLTSTLHEDDDPQLADYPRLPFVSKQLRPPRGWEDPQFRRNFGETLHEQEEIVSMWGPDVPVVPPQTAARWFSIAVLGFVGLGVIVNYAPFEIPAVRREYPFSGLVSELGSLEANTARVEQDTEVDE
ncbi:hypothetical protein LXA43DRAFT_969460 [Ganoderma leucocontextum]|nr:hypothetical protein LXA43DRAFT_969460 [Ganoderma leucocontextum]